MTGKGDAPVAAPDGPAAGQTPLHARGGCLTWQHNAADSAGGAIRLALSGRADLRNRKRPHTAFRENPIEIGLQCLHNPLTLTLRHGLYWRHVHFTRDVPARRRTRSPFTERFTHEPENIFQNIRPTQQAELESEAIKVRPQTVKASHQKCSSTPPPSSSTSSTRARRLRRAAGALPTARPRPRRRPASNAGAALELFWSPRDDRSARWQSCTTRTRASRKLRQFDRAAGFVASVQAYVAARRQE
jgi:hypothetical protein